MDPIHPPLILKIMPIVKILETTEREVIVDQFPSFYRSERLFFFCAVVSPTKIIKVVKFDSFTSISLGDDVKAAYDQNMIPCTREEFIEASSVCHTLILNSLTHEIE